MKTRITLFIMLISLISLYGQFSLDLETGLNFSGYNDLKIPNDAVSSDLSLSEELDSPIVWASRANLHYLIHPRHELSLLYAPLTINAKGTVNRDILYQGEVFDAGEEIKAKYRFDSYRLQYLYRFPNQNGIVRGLGLSLKLRDAAITLENTDTKATKPNTGFVPLIGFEFGYLIREDLDLLLKGEALASPYGRAEDVILSLNYKINEDYSLFGGYRILEGGADNDEVYTFSLFHYAMIGARIKF
ncbi:MAG: hypothetical protein V3576_05410 [Candidatus Cloacimonadota bacterium]